MANMSLDQRVRECLATLQDELGGKVLAPRLNLSPGHLSRMIGGSRAIPVGLVPLLVELDPSLGAWLADALPFWRGIHARVLQRLEPADREKVERLYFQEFYPGRVGR